MSRFVLDATVTMAWCFTEEATDLTRGLLGRLSNLTDIAVVPVLWLYEVVNVVELAVRKGRISREKALAFLESLADLPIEVEHPSRTQVFVNVRTLATQYQLTAYDAAYLELGIRYKLPIASLDNALSRAALATGIQAVQA